MKKKKYKRTQTQIDIYGFREKEFGTRVGKVERCWLKFQHIIPFFCLRTK